MTPRFKKGDSVTYVGLTTLLSKTLNGHNGVIKIIHSSGPQCSTTYMVEFSFIEVYEENEIRQITKSYLCREESLVPNNYLTDSDFEVVN